jgi:hypothetical protein
MKNSFLMTFFLISFLTISVFSQADEINSQDDLYLNFHSNTTVNVQGYNGYFEAVKFWRVNSGETPVLSNPTKIYARAWFNQDGGGSTDVMLRVAFNGTPLKKRVVTSGAEYLMKRTPDLNENWLSWYAHLDDTHFPKVFALDTISGAYGDSFAISFPIPFKLNVPRSVRMGGSDLLVEAQPILAGAGTPQTGDIRFYPATQFDRSKVFISGTPLTNPGSVSMNFPPGDWITGSPGWGIGVHEGFTGIGVCNDKVVRFSDKKFLFRACSITVQPVSITVTRPS